MLKKKVKKAIQRKLKATEDYRITTHFYMKKLKSRIFTKSLFDIFHIKISI